MYIYHNTLQIIRVYSIYNFTPSENLINKARQKLPVRPDLQYQQQKQQYNIRKMYTHKTLSPPPTSNFHTTPHPSHPSKYISLYIPNTNLTPYNQNQLHISKMMLPQPTKVLFESGKSVRCHTLKRHKFGKLNVSHQDKAALEAQASQSSEKNGHNSHSGKKIAIKLLENKNKQVFGKLEIRINKPGRYSPFNNLKKSPQKSQQKQRKQKSIYQQALINHTHITARELINMIKNQPKIAQKLQNINKQLYDNQQSQSVEMSSKTNSEKFRMSISRMLQNTTNRTSFNYITKFYKKPIQQEMEVKKVKKTNQNINQILNVCQYRPISHTKHSRWHKSSQGRCRCMRNTIDSDMHRLNNTSYVGKRKDLKQSNNKNEPHSLSVSPRKPVTSHNPQRNVVTLNLPDNWVVDSWNTQSRFDGNPSIFRD